MGGCMIGFFSLKRENLAKYTKILSYSLRIEVHFYVLGVLRSGNANYALPPLRNGFLALFWLGAEGFGHASFLSEQKRARPRLASSPLADEAPAFESHIEQI